MDKIYVTEEGLKELIAKKEYLINVEKPKNLQELEEARAQGDLSENADYDAARNKQAEIEAKTKELEEIIDNAVIIVADENCSEVKIGTYVLLRLSYLKKDVQYHIVGTTETNPLENKISNECELAKAINGHKVGDVVSVNAKKSYEVKVLAISSHKII